MQPSPLEAFAVSFPIFALVLVAIALAIHKFRELFKKRKQCWRRHICVFTSNAILGLTFLPFAAMYHPSLNEVMKEQVRQDEDVDEDDSSDPEMPHKLLLRQLQRIRRGERVGSLTLRLK